MLWPKSTVDSPTRKTPSSESLLDVIVTSNDNLAGKALVIDQGISDHSAQVMRIIVDPKSLKLRIKK